MIKKLKTLEDDEIDMSVGAVNTRFADTELVRKINELVDAVNELQENQNTYWTDIAELKKELQTRAENVQPDAESRSENVLTKSLRMDKEFAEDECVRLQNELERTRKALAVAVDALKEIDKTRSVANHKIGTQDKTLNSGIVFCWATPDEIHNALTEITALEQKDVK